MKRLWALTAMCSAMVLHPGLRADPILSPTIRALTNGEMTKAIGRVPIVGSHGTVAGLVLTAERMAGRRHRVATVIVRRAETRADEPVPAETHDKEDAHGH